MCGTCAPDAPIHDRLAPGARGAVSPLLHQCEGRGCTKGRGWRIGGAVHLDDDRRARAVRTRSAAEGLIGAISAWEPAMQYLYRAGEHDRPPRPSPDGDDERTPALFTASGSRGSAPSPETSSSTVPRRATVHPGTTRRSVSRGTARPEELPDTDGGEDRLRPEHLSDAIVQRWGQFRRQVRVLAAEVRSPLRGVESV